ncbi:ArsR/SmtB family transcription factor [Pseudarthrobacter sp. P1]|uniref:ArsR/SmtB family transcription factor n=1 Tax=Pseudarthrobacter sp. P1 TaxID=3418418 RepID=UPI003CE9B9BF
MLKYSSGLDAIFQALADPSRRAILERLTQGPASVSALAQPLAMSLPAVVQHLAVLENAQLITTQKIGRVRTCTLGSTALRTAEAWLTERRTPAEHHLDRLADYLASHPEQPTKDMP